MKRALLIAVVLTTLTGASRAGEIYGGAGLPGLMLGYAQPIDERFTVRGDWATLGSHRKQITEEGVTYDAKGSFNRLGLFADWFVSGGFRLTGGMTFNNFKADLVAQGDGVTQFTVGGRTFVADPADRLDVKIRYPKVTPYLGVGYGHQLGGGWGFTFDLGASYGRATVSETHSGPNLGNPAVVTQADIDAEMAELRDGVAKVRYVPQVSLGFSYRF
jgi:hypothetical protein